MAFIYADPVPAQQAVQYAQLKAQEQAQHQQVLRDIAQQGIAQQSAAAQRAMTQSQMNQQSSEAEKNRQARAVENSQILASNERVAGIRSADRRSFDLGAEKFDSLAALIETEDPPTDSEFNALATGITPERVAPLKIALDQRRRSLNALASEAKQLSDYWNRIFDDVKVGEDKKFKTAKEEFFKDKRANELLSKDPRFPMRVVPKYSGPRLDAPVAPVAPTALPPSPIGVTPISELLRARGVQGGAIMDEPPAPMIDPYSRPRFAVPWEPY